MFCSKRDFSRLALLGLLGAVTSGSRASGTTSVVLTFHHENVMGTSLELRVSAKDDAAARRAEGLALAEIDRLAGLLGNHDPSSEFRRWQETRGEPVAISRELFAMLQESDHWRIRSGGAFDPRVQSLSRVWSRRAREGRRPSPEEIHSAREELTRTGWRLDPTARTAARLGDGPITLDAIAKGEILELACDALVRGIPELEGVLLNVGGDLHVRGEVPALIGVVAPWNDAESAPPLAKVALHNVAMATSGGSQRGYQVGSRWYSHLLDPRTGEPASAVIGATVVAPRGSVADALATTLNVLDPDEGLRLVEDTPGAACLIMKADRTVVASRRWRELVQPIENPLPLARDEPVAAGGHWSDEFELVVNFEISPPPAGEGRYRRPYVAVWVENKDGFPVRNLLLWVSQGGPGPFQWLPDLKRWFMSDQSRKKVDRTDMVITMSRPTRPPGRYTVFWDGKDAKGNPLPPGNYTVCIDAAREHGTYQGMRQSVVMGGDPVSKDLPGGVEIKAATIAYRRKTRP